MHHTQFVTELSVVEIPLGGQNDFVLYQTLLHEREKSYVKDVYLKYESQLVTENYPQTVEFFTLLDALVKKTPVHKENKFFIQVQKTEKNKTITSLQCLIDKHRYIEPSEAKTMLQLYNESKIGLSFRLVLIGKKVFNTTVELDVVQGASKIPASGNIEDVVKTILEGNGMVYDNTPYISGNINKLLCKLKKAGKKD